MAAKCPEIQFTVEHKRGHAGAALDARNADPIDHSLGDGRERSDRLDHFRRRHVLALPAKRIAKAVDKIKIALLVLAHQVTRG